MEFQNIEQIQKTRDYNLFKSLDGNRRLKKSSIKKLKISIEKDNRLNIHPIIVNSQYEVIDGQHRLEVARQLGIDIFFIKSDSVHESHIIEANVNQTPWEVENYIDYFAVKDKIQDYIELKKLMASTNLKPKALLNLILGTVSTEMLNFLKTGKFRSPRNKNYENTVSNYLDFISYVKDKRVSPFSMFSNHFFTKAYRWLLSTNGFDYQLFIKKLDLRWFDLKPQKGAEEWYKLLISIYNFKNQNRLEEEYGKTAQI